MLSKLNRNADSAEDDNQSLQWIVDRQRDSARTLTAWREFSKKDLSAVCRCSRYKLDATGTKNVMAHRFYCHFRPAGSSSTVSTDEGGSHEKSSREEAFTITTTEKNQPIVQVSLEDFDALIKDAVSSVMASQERETRLTEPTIPPLSPSSHSLMQAASHPQRNQEQEAALTITGPRYSGIGNTAASFMAHGKEADTAGQETGMELITVGKNTSINKSKGIH